MNNILNEIEKCGIIPVISLDNLDKALPLAKALYEADIKCLEITLRTNNACEIIEKISEEYDDLFIGAGTVLTIEQAEKAIKSGAKFIVSPGLNEKVVNYCKEKDILVIPGVLTPTEIEKALELELNTVKFFPSEPSGGINMIKALCAPYKELKFMPTGGININNLVDYLKNENIIACGGSWMVSGELIDNDDFETIKNKAIEAKNIVDSVRDKVYLKI